MQTKYNKCNSWLVFIRIMTGIVFTGVKTKMTKREMEQNLNHFDDVLLLLLLLILDQASTGYSERANRR